MTQWSKEDLEEMCGDDIIDQLAFLSGCFKYKLSNDVVVPDGWIISDELLRKFSELIVRECIKEIGYKSADLLDIDFYPHYQERLKKRFGVKE